MDPLQRIEDRGRCCCFTGHRDMPYQAMEVLLPRLTEAVKELLSKGVDTYLVGGALGFDTVAAIQLINLRRHLYPQLRVVLVRPCADQAAKWPTAQKILYETVRREADGDILLSDRYYPGCMQKRNAFMVEHSSHLIAYVTRRSGGSYQTATLAQKQGLHIQNLAEGGVALTFPEQQGLFDGI